MTTAVALRDNELMLGGPIGSLDHYIQAVSAVPILTKEEEFELATRLREEDDLEAAQQLILSHLRFVVHIARGYSGYGLPLGDLIQEGNVGLMKAVKRFDPDVGVRLVSFAVHWIRAEIHEYVLKNWRLVKVATTKAQRKLFFNLRKAKKNLGWLSKAETEIARIVWKLGEATVRQVLEAVSSSRNIEYKTVQTYLRRLETKGYVRARKSGRSTVYSPRVRPAQVIKETVNDFVDRLFDGEALPLVEHLVRERVRAAEAPGP